MKDAASQSFRETIMVAIGDGVFQERLTGAFSGIVTWAQLSELWSVVKQAPDGWYIYAIGETPPERPAKADALMAFIQEIDALLRKEHREEYCGIVYADNKAEPSFIKIFDPHHLGSSCGSSGVKTLPGWLLTRMRPDALHEDRPLPEGRKRWWRGLFQKQPA